MAFPKPSLTGARVDTLATALRLNPSGAPFVGLDGSRRFGSEAWGPLASLRARVLRPSGGPSRFSSALAARIAARRTVGGPGGTGIAVILSYDPESSSPERFDDLVLEVDAALRGSDDGPRLVFRKDRIREEELRHLRREVARESEVAAPPRPPDSPPAPPPRTSLPRGPFVAAVRSILRHLRDGDIYQANLTQQFHAPFHGNDADLWFRIRAQTPAPRAALVRGAGATLVSASPETFVDVSPEGEARTIPIKGTRPRSDDPAEDAASARDLCSSEKDRAELLMIVDLERNDLGRVSEIGTVRVPELMALRSYPSVHHLVATVSSRLRQGIGIEAWVDSVFPGGSVTGAPKKRAMEILRSLEPVPRGWYTGSLFWFDDDGWTRSSILIRSVVIRGGVARIGAGGGIVADSDPEAEWCEANHKARPLLRALGCKPEDAR